MLGIIITGHNEFASGLYSSLQMIGGQQHNVEVVTFLDQEDEMILRQHMTEALNKLNSCDEIVIMCDLLGGSPFKIAATLSVNNPKMHVIYGFNLGMLLELSLSRESAMDIDSYLDGIVSSGQKNMGRYVYKKITENDLGEGI